jgi:hypothetical protein
MRVLVFIVRYIFILRVAARDRERRGREAILYWQEGYMIIVCDFVYSMDTPETKE